MSKFRVWFLTASSVFSTSSTMTVFGFCLDCAIVCLLVLSISAYSVLNSSVICSALACACSSFPAVTWLVLNMFVTVARSVSSWVCRWVAICKSLSTSLRLFCIAVLLFSLCSSLSAVSITGVSPFAVAALRLSICVFSYCWCLASSPASLLISLFICSCSFLT